METFLSAPLFIFEQIMGEEIIVRTHADQLLPAISKWGMLQNQRGIEFVFRCVSRAFGQQFPARVYRDPDRCE
ncbi:MAG: hypothetical protein DMG65_25470 [Candidatus Angelobacter sp. Gp1-AA117]|nr:MAG: hypothetical protein DMG65_25470 [Candidatus Angelobacter sp. Gp1-AA117]